MTRDNPLLMTSYPMPDRVYDVFVDGNFLYLANNNYGLRVVEISNPAIPQMIAYYDPPNRARGVKVLDNTLAFVADFSSGLQIIDLTAVHMIFTDQDGDGYFTPGDCNDDNAGINPGAAEICDGIDNNCNSLPDDFCVTDSDGDGVPDDEDNCPAIANSGQSDVNNNGIGDVCDAESDSDNDGFVDSADNCPGIANDQTDDNVNGIGDVCDPELDWDNDGFSNSVDNCPSNPNDQSDLDGDNIGDVCDDDIDGDGMSNVYEDVYGFDKYDGNDGPADFDGDVYTNADEAIAGFNPWVADGVPLSLTGALSTTGKSVGMTLVGSMAYMAEGGTGGLRIVDVSDAAAPVEVSMLNTPDRALAVAVAGNYAYVADRNMGLQVYNVATLATPFAVGSLETPGESATTVAVTGNTLYLGSGNALHVINITTPESPSEVTTYTFAGAVMDLEIAGTTLYVATGEEGVRAFDITDPSAPVDQGLINTSTIAQAVSVSGTTVFIADFYNGLQIADFSDPNNPRMVASYDVPGWLYDVFVEGNTVYLANDNYGLRVVDVTNLSHPQMIAFYDTPASARNVKVASSYAYVADFSSGLQIIDLTNVQIGVPVRVYFDYEYLESSGQISIEPWDYFNIEDGTITTSANRDMDSELELWGGSLHVTCNDNLFAIPLNQEYASVTSTDFEAATYDRLNIAPSVGLVFLQKANQGSDYCDGPFWGDAKFHITAIDRTPLDITDQDGDGYYTPGDCNDNDAGINPGEAEICDGIDNNCNTLPDDFCVPDNGGEPDPDAFDASNVSAGMFNETYPATADPEDPTVLQRNYLYVTVEGASQAGSVDAHVEDPDASILTFPTIFPVDDAPITKRKAETGLISGVYTFTFTDGQGNQAVQEVLNTTPVPVPLVDVNTIQVRLNPDNTTTISWAPLAEPFTFWYTIFIRDVTNNQTAYASDPDMNVSLTLPYGILTAGVDYTVEVRAQDGPTDELCFNRSRSKVYSFNLGGTGLVSGTIPSADSLLPGCRRRHAESRRLFRKS